MTWGKYKSIFSLMLHVYQELMSGSVLCDHTGTPADRTAISEVASFVPEGTERSSGQS